MASSVITREAMFCLPNACICACQLQLNKSIIVPRWHSKRSDGRCPWYPVSPWTDHLRTCNIISLSHCSPCPPWCVTTEPRCLTQSLWPCHVSAGAEVGTGVVWQPSTCCNTEFLRAFQPERCSPVGTFDHLSGSDALRNSATFEHLSG